MYALSVRGLSKTYGNGVQALRGIDLDVERGDFFALLGPNGAGKTTLIGIITSLVNKSGGTASVFGHDIDRELDAAKACIGIVPQEINFNMFETPFTIVVNQAGFYGIPRAVGSSRISSRGSCISARAIIRRRFMPPERLRDMLLRLSHSCSCRRYCSARARATGRGMP